MPLNPNALAEVKTLGFPFAVDSGGRIAASLSGGAGGDEAIRGKIVQILFTTPGERVHQPEFGCGLFDLVFEPNDSVLAATMELAVAEALTRWLEDDITVDAVEVESEGEQASVEIVYTRKRDRVRQALRVRFQ